MGRRIYHGDEFVYKYEFAQQSSEAHRLYEEFDIGTHNLDADNPAFSISKDELLKLKELIKEKENYKLFEEEVEKFTEDGFISIAKYNELIKKHNINKDYWFMNLCKAIYDYSNDYFSKHPKRKIIHFSDEW